ncbi:hypothetical protein K431DRAFT_341237 [Polychaeton citri CBS 116435]|uniref:Uncharacterized protein n=1 Tax=Polychaeton citri CBS 116435 TaxID=1314669 RepID=A0A9P4PZ32_9PEZI|nr:hypothetical protein K431DRAFT_341237 [Polychaeton citri CBS 116435]
MSSSHNVPQTSKASQATTANTKPNRLPAPTLFVGPPSRNASQLSMHNPFPSGNDDTHQFHHSTNTTTNPAQKPPRGKSALKHEFTNEDNKNASKDGAPTTRLQKPSPKSLDARWREMQSTLNEVELTAQNTTHVFGASHAAALQELRTAQIALARAWGRGNEEQRRAAQENGAATSMTSVAPELGAGSSEKFKVAHDLASDRFRANRDRAGTTTSVSTSLSDESDKGSKTTTSAKSQLEEETAQDIRLASERRAANEDYFNKVDAGVKEVVAKLGVVAEAMRGVEGEARSLWSATTDSPTDMRHNKK